MSYSGMYAHSFEFTSGTSSGAMYEFKCEPDPNSKYCFIFSDDEEIEDNSDDDYHPEKSHVKQPKTSTKTKKSNPVGRPRKNGQNKTKSKTVTKVSRPVGRPPNKKKNVNNKKTTTTIVTPKKSLKPKNDLRKKSILESLEANISEEDHNITEQKIEEMKIEDEKSNVIESQKVMIEKLMKENALLLQKQQQQQQHQQQQQQQQQQEQPPIVSYIEETDEMTPEVVSEYEDDYRNINNFVNTVIEDITTTTSTTTTTTEITNEHVHEFNGDYYNWYAIVRDNALCQRLYHISTEQLSILDKFMISYFAKTNNPISNAVSHTKQLLMVLDYILNGTNTTMIANRANLPPQFTHSLIHLFINAHAKILHKRTNSISNQHLTQIRFNGRNNEIFYVLIDQKTDRIISHQIYKDATKYVNWPFKGLNITTAREDFSTSFVDRLSRLCNLLVDHSLLFDHMAIRLCYAIWNKLKC